MRGEKLQASGLSVQFGGVEILRVPEFEVSAGALVALTGPSGSGKTTLLHVLAAILRPRAGRVGWGETDVAALGEGAADAWRRRHVGLIFQDFHLIEQLSPLNNVVLPATFSHWHVPAESRRAAQGLLDRLGVPAGARSVSTLSRGERQRVAIARALLADPGIILADEPTASLDEDAARAITTILTDAASTGRTVIAVSHDPLVIGAAGRVVRLEHGSIVSDSRPAAHPAREAASA